MTLARRQGETQRQFVERDLVASGRIKAYDCMYTLEYEDGSRCSITRLAAVINDLRRDGWTIDTTGPHGQLAVYHLRTRPGGRSAEPEWSRGWRCADCGGNPANQPETLLGNMGRAYCGGCGAQRLFRKSVAA